MDFVIKKCSPQTQVDDCILKFWKADPESENISNTPSGE